MKKEAIWHTKLIKPRKRCSPLRTVGLPPRLGNCEEPAEDLDGAAPAAPGGPREGRANLTGLVLGYIEASKQVRSVLPRKEKRHRCPRATQMHGSQIVKVNTHWNSYLQSPKRRLRKRDIKRD